MSKTLGQITFKLGQIGLLQQENLTCPDKTKIYIYKKTYFFSKFFTD